jgi:sortase (surface protein transpeptidase)
MVEHMPTFTKLIAKHAGLVLILLGLCGLIVSVSLYLKSSQPPRVTSVKVNVTPSSVKLTPKILANYTVAPHDPKFISIPGINLSDVPVVRLGLLPGGAIATPDSIYKAGWYQGSSLPGQSGAMFIYGHVSSWTADGVFYNLKKLSPGNMVTITRGDNKIYSYRVVAIKTYPYNNVDMRSVLSAINPKIPGLNLMTCSGKVITGTSEFSKRLVIFTSLVSS